MWWMGLEKPVSEAGMGFCDGMVGLFFDWRESEGRRGKKKL
jgi:hypothetical protein